MMDMPSKSKADAGGLTRCDEGDGCAGKGSKGGKGMEADMIKNFF